MVFGATEATIPTLIVEHGFEEAVPVDIGPENTVPSTKVADAKISYSGKGTLADANRPGWLSRFFNSPWFPF